MRSAKAPQINAGVMIAKGHLEGHIDRFRDRLREVVDAVDRHVAQHRLAESADERGCPR